MIVRNYADHAVLPGHLRITVRTAGQNARLLAAVDEWRAPQK
jgi:histidinol-phosphate/aromatic aminotransferase/cobyric acid decarboxylase-like protein